MKVYPLFDQFREQVVIWGQGRWWLPRAILSVYLSLLTFDLFADSTTWTWFTPVNLGIHETGHLVFRLSGIRFLEILGGTIAQIAAPLFLIYSFLQQGDLFAPAFGAFWLGTNTLNISVYMSDARARILPLVTVGGGKHIIHDWNFLLGQLGFLSYDTFFGTLTWIASFIAMGGACAYGFWVCWLIAFPTALKPEMHD